MRSWLSNPTVEKRLGFFGLPPRFPKVVIESGEVFSVSDSGLRLKMNAMTTDRFATRRLIDVSRV